MKLQSTLLYSCTLFANLISKCNCQQTESIYPNERYSENLFLKYVPNQLYSGSSEFGNKVIAQFDFLISRTLTEDVQAHYRLYPRLIGDLVQKSNITSFQLSFSQGKWNTELWGNPPINSAATGAEIYSRLGNGIGKRQADWKELINSLSGVFCASLNQADMKNVVLPQFAYIDNTSIGGGNNDQKVSSTDFFHVFLAQENLCTENLTPFLKQLPCQAKGGIASLLNAHKLLNSEYYSMAISHTEECVDEQCKKKQWKFKQSITVVFKNDGDTIDTEKLFKAKLTKICPVSESSKIYFIKEKSDPSISLSSLVQSPSAKEIEIDESTRALEFDLLATELEPKIEINVAEFKKEKRIDYIVGVHKHITGPPGVKGGIQIVLENKSSVEQDIVLFDSTPWFLQVYLHTLNIKSDGQKVDIDPKNLYFRPAIYRERPALLELKMKLKPKSTTTISYEFDRVFIKMNEHPPDANRGFNVGPTVVEFRMNMQDKDTSEKVMPLVCRINQLLSHGKMKTCRVRVYSELFLAYLPTPDFSMPYNVITFTLTVVALYFGRLFNLYSKRFGYEID